MPYIKQEMRDQLPLEAIWDIMEGDKKIVRVGNQNQCQVQETIKMRFSLNGAVVFYHFHVMKDLAYPLILGRNILRDLKVEINTEQHRVTLFLVWPVSLSSTNLVQQYTVWSFQPQQAQLH